MGADHDSLFARRIDNTEDIRKVESAMADIFLIGEVLCGDKIAVRFQKVENIIETLLMGGKTGISRSKRALHIEIVPCGALIKEIRLRTC
jgi:hypothetical protein